MLSASGNIFSREERTELQRFGAVGDICFRFFKLRACRRVVGVVRDVNKVAAILGILRGNLSMS